MTTIKYGAKCDGPGSDPSGCSVAFNDYDTGTIIRCSDCGEDFCPSCVKITGHTVVRSIEDSCGCSECNGPSLACPDFVNDPAHGYAIESTR